MAPVWKFTAMRFVAWDGACATNERPAAAHMIAMVVRYLGHLRGRLARRVCRVGRPFSPIGLGSHAPAGALVFRAGAPLALVPKRFPAPHLGGGPR